MVGSVLMADFPTREELAAWLTGDPYVTDGVWQEVHVGLGIDPGDARRPGHLVLVAHLFFISAEAATHFYGLVTSHRPDEPCAGCAHPR